MKKIAYDQTCDPGYAYLRAVLDRYPALKEISKTANIDESEFSGLPDTAFAWPQERRYPLHTKEHTALSLGYRKLANSAPVEVDKELEKAAAVYGIDPAIYATPQIEKVASSAQYIFPEKKRFLVKTAEDVKLAEQRLHECYPRLTIEDRLEGLMRLRKIAQVHDVSLHPSTVKLASFTLTSTKKLKDWLEARSTVSRADVFRDAYTKLASSLDGVASEFKDRDVQVKLASAIHNLDQEAGLTKYYGRKLPDPLRTVFNSEKLAEDTLELGTGLMLNKNKLAALPLSFWSDLLGDDVAREISSDGESVNPEALMQLLPTLPNDLKAIAQKQLAAYK
jgi:hypothetical protein